MPGLLETIDALLAQVRAGGDNRMVQAGLGAIVRAHHGAPPEERARGMAKLAAVVVADPWLRAAGVAALVGGALVELGGPPEPLAGPVLGRLCGVLVAARRFVDVCLARAPTEEPDTGSTMDGRRVPAEVVQATWTEDREGGDAWMHLRHWCLPSITLLSLAPPLRPLLVGELLAPAQALAEGDPHARFLATLLQVLDDAPALVFETVGGRGFRVRMSGVADNFQLQTLLQGALAEAGLPCGAPDPGVLATAQGRGPQESGRQGLGVWDLYDGRALGCEGPVPTELWIWGEGTPAEIPLVAGVRAIVLGPPSYQRAWNGVRLFTHLPASVRVEAELTPAEVAEWRVRLGGGLA